MKSIWIKVALPLVVIGLGFGGMKAIEASASEESEKETVDTRPTVSIKSLEAKDHPVTITSFGEVAPLESTRLAAQVSGEVIDWHKEFVAGGLIRKGEILFSIEKDTYEAALLQAEANLATAQAQLIEEQARANVAAKEAKSLPASQVTDLYLRKPQLISAEAAVKSAQARLKIAQRDLANCEVKAPYDALVMSREIGLGQYVMQGTPVAEISNVETAEIIFPIAGFDNQFLPATVQGIEAEVMGKGYASATRSGFIHRDLGVVDKSTRMSHLVVRVDDPYSLKTEQAPLKFGTYATVKFVGKTLNNLFRLPQEIVNNRMVWTVDKDGLLQSKRVEIVREEGRDFLIGSGLSENDSIVMSLPEYPRNGMAVKIVENNSNLIASK